MFSTPFPLLQNDPTVKLLCKCLPLLKCLLSIRNCCTQGPFLIRALFQRGIKNPITLSLGGMKANLLIQHHHWQIDFIQKTSKHRVPSANSAFLANKALPAFCYDFSFPNGFKPQQFPPVFLKGGVSIFHQMKDPRAGLQGVQESLILKAHCSYVDVFLEKRSMDSIKFTTCSMTLT